MKLFPCGEHYPGGGSASAPYRMRSGWSRMRKWRWCGAGSTLVRDSQEAVCADGDAEVNDPHVEELIYHIQTGDGLDFQDPPPVEDETDAFRIMLDDGIATFSMKEHHPTEESARRMVEGYLRAWELDVALQYDSSELRFVFDRSEIVD